MDAAPLVSVGIPTYDRPEGLERAVRSALAQDERDLEVVVADDASPNPDVERVGRALAAEDPRVRFVRNAENLGHDGNYQHVLELARGEHFMWLSDDDWIDPAYVSRCLAELRADPAAVLVCGAARYDDGVEERPITLLDPRPGARVARYFSRVSVNGPLFGVMRRADLLQVGFPPVPGGDWLLVARMAARGRVRTLRDVHIHRSASGIGGDAEGLARSFGLTGFFARHHHVLVARQVATLPVSRAAALLSAALVLVRFPGFTLARRLGAGRLEAPLAAWLRKRSA